MVEWLHYEKKLLKQDIIENAIADVILLFFTLMCAAVLRYFFKEITIDFSYLFGIITGFIIIEARRWMDIN